MDKNELDIILNKVAAANNTTAEHVREEIQAAMEYAMNDPDPAIQAKWAKIPRKGNKVSLEEFLEYVVQIVTS